MQSPFVKAFVCNVLYSCNGTTITVNKLQNEMHSIDTIRLLNCCSFYSWQSTSQIKLFSQIGHTHTHHSETQHAKISVATELVYPHWDQRKTFQLTAFSTPHLYEERTCERSSLSLTSFRMHCDSNTHTHLSEVWVASDNNKKSNNKNNSNNDSTWKIAFILFRMKVHFIPFRFISFLYVHLGSLNPPFFPNILCCKQFVLPTN